MDATASPRNAIDRRSTAPSGAKRSLPLYVMKTVFEPANGLALNAANLIGIVSLIFGSLMVVVTLKYVTLIILRACARTPSA